MPNQQQPERPSGFSNDQSGELLCWPVPEELSRSAAVVYRNAFGRALAQRSVVHLVESYVYMDPPAMASQVRLAAAAVGMNFSGVGVELGAGCGLLSATVARYRGVEKIYSVEVCEELAKLIRRVATEVSGTCAGKVIPVVGSFDDIRLPSESVDFAIEIDSLHHSDNLEQTLRECWRLLRPGGRMMLLDRCHPNSVTDEQVKAMLDIVYSRHFLEQNCYPTHVTLTRRENGEHEYRLFEWQNAFRSSGFTLVGAKRFNGMIRGATAAKCLLSFMPESVRRKLYKTENGSFRQLAAFVRQYLTLPFQRSDLGRVGLAPRETTVFLIEKPKKNA